MAMAQTSCLDATQHNVGYRITVIYPMRDNDLGGRENAETKKFRPKAGRNKYNYLKTIGLSCTAYNPHYVAQHPKMPFM
jgi:hypothetical protein